MQRRLRAKTPAPPQRPVAELEDFAKLEDPNARCSSYLVTFPHPQAAVSASGVPLRAPESFSRAQLRDALLDSCAHPEHRDARARQQGSAVQLNQLGVFKELHVANAQGQVHGHAYSPVPGDTRGFRLLPVRRALLTRHGLASHWSPHEGYLSAVRYCFWPTPKKPTATLDKDYLSCARSPPHPPLHECCREPNTAD